MFEKSSIARKTIILLLLPMLEAGDMTGYKSAHSVPMEYYFRRHSMLVKNPDVRECQCPPHRECTIEFKMNEDMIHFLKLRGLLTDEDYKTYQEDLENYRKFNGLSPKEFIRQNRFRRSNDYDDQCCCPPQSVFMPTFITEKKFKKVVDRFKTKQAHPFN